MRFTLLLFLNLSLGIVYGQSKPQVPDPPGTIQLSENLYMDKSPVTNQMFFEYLKMKNYLKSRGYDSWKTYYTDKNDTEWTTGPVIIYPSFLRTLEAEESILSKNGYFWNYRYTRAPVLRVTKSQAEDFCKWRTEMVEYAWAYFPKNAHQEDLAHKIQYRLPTAEELAMAENYFSEHGKLVRIKKKDPLRYRSPKATDAFLLYNISEFTSSDGLYGKNWKNIDTDVFPNDFTGFRCVCEVTE